MYFDKYTWKRSLSANDWPGFLLLEVGDISLTTPSVCHREECWRDRPRTSMWPKVELVASFILRRVTEGLARAESVVGPRARQWAKGIKNPYPHSWPSSGRAENINIRNK